MFSISITIGVTHVSEANMCKCILRLTCECVYMFAETLRQFRDQRPVSGLEQKFVLSYACTLVSLSVSETEGKIICHCLCTADGVYVPCIYS